jgi:hypothetical protein
MGNYYMKYCLILAEILFAKVDIEQNINALSRSSRPKPLTTTRNFRLIEAENLHHQKDTANLSQKQSVKCSAWLHNKDV